MAKPQNAIIHVEQMSRYRNYPAALTTPPRPLNIALPETHLNSSVWFEEIDFIYLKGYFPKGCDQDEIFTI